MSTAHVPYHELLWRCMLWVRKLWIYEDLSVMCHLMYSSVSALTPWLSLSLSPSNQNEAVRNVDVTSDWMASLKQIYEDAIIDAKRGHKQSECVVSQLCSLRLWRSKQLQSSSTLSIVGKNGQKKKPFSRHQFKVFIATAGDVQPHSGKVVQRNGLCSVCWSFWD